MGYVKAMGKKELHKRDEWGHELNVVLGNGGRNNTMNADRYVRQRSPNYTLKKKFPHTRWWKHNTYSDND